MMDKRRSIERPRPDPRIATIVRHYRDEAGLTRKQLAAQCNLSEFTIAKLENGTRGMGISAMSRLGQALGRDFQYRMMKVLAEA